MLISSLLEHALDVMAQRQDVCLVHEGSAVQTPAEAEKNVCTRKSHSVIHTRLDDVRNFLAFNVRRLRSALSYITREVLFVHMSGNMSLIAIISVYRWKYYQHT